MRNLEYLILYGWHSFQDENHRFFNIPSKFIRTFYIFNGARWQKMQEKYIKYERNEAKLNETKHRIKIYLTFIQIGH